MADPIVLGYDESPSANAALEATIRIAPVVGAKVVVVFGYYISPLGGLQHGSIQEALGSGRTPGGRSRGSRTRGRRRRGRVAARLGQAGGRADRGREGGRREHDRRRDGRRESDHRRDPRLGRAPARPAIAVAGPRRPDRAFGVTVVGAPVEIDRPRIRELIEREGARLERADQAASRAMYERARRTLAGGVASSYQVRDPWPIYLTHGEGQRVWDVDGTEYLDFHNGFGSMTQGHAHPAITRAVAERAALGTHFAAPTEDGIVVAEELARRFRLPKWRYTNSGSEATMDAIRIARAHTGRDVVAEDLRLVPRPPRHGDGLDRRRLRPDRRPRRPRLAALRRRHPAGGRRPDRRRCRSTTPARWSGGSTGSPPRGGCPPA